MSEIIVKGVVLLKTPPEPTDQEIICPKCGGKRQVLKSRCCPDAGHCMTKKVLGYMEDPQSRKKDVPIWSDEFDQTSAFCGAQTFLVCGTCHKSEEYKPKAAITEGSPGNVEVAQG